MSWFLEFWNLATRWVLCCQNRALQLNFEARECIFKLEQSWGNQFHFCTESPDTKNMNHHISVTKVNLNWCNSHNKQCSTNMSTGIQGNINRPYYIINSRWQCMFSKAIVVLVQTKQGWIKRSSEQKENSFPWQQQQQHNIILSLLD